MTFHILGPIELSVDGRAADLGATKVRGLLGILLLSANTVVTTATLASRLWDEPSGRDTAHCSVKGRDLPPNPGKTLQTYVTRLRDVLDKAGSPAKLTNEHHAYRLHVDAATVDYHQFQQLAAAGRHASQHGDLGRTVELLGQAVALWHGSPLADLATSWVRGYRETLVASELLPAYYKLIDAELTLGYHEVVLSRLRPLLAQHDTDETLAGLWMRTVAALDGPDKLPSYFRAFVSRVRTTMQDEPSDRLVHLYEQLTRPHTPARTAVESRTVPRHLPRPSPYFAGRSDAMEQLDTLVFGGTDQPVVAIDGAAGVGKTEVVVQWGSTRRQHFPDGDLYANLSGFGPGAPIDASTVLTTFLNALQLPAEHLPRNAQDRAALLRHTLSNRRMLIVLDNVRDSEHARPLLTATGSCPVLITSRQQLTGLVHRDGAQRITLGKLTPPASAALLARRIGEARANRDHAAVHDLAALCDGLPLGLRVAAEHVAASPGAPVRGLVDNLIRHRRLLLDTGSHGDDNSTTLRAVFAWSCDDLRPDANRLYRLLGLHPSTSFSTAAAATLAELSLGDTERILDVLVGAHLVERQGADRYQLHDLLLLFAAELVDGEHPNVRRAALLRLLDWYLGSVVNAARILMAHHVEAPSLLPASGITPQTFENEQDALHWCISERSNIIAASRRASEVGFHDHAWRLVGEFDDVLVRYGDPHDLLEIHHSAIASARISGAKEGEAELLNNLAVFHAHLDAYGQAATHFRQAQAIYKTTNDVYGEAVALLNIASMYMERRKFPAAINLYEHAVTLFEEVGNSVGCAHAYHRLGDTYRRMDRYGVAADFYKRALQLREGIPRGQADTLTALGELQLQQGHPVGAIEYCEAALTFHRRALDTRRTAKALETLASAYHRVQRYGDAIRSGNEATDQYGGINDLRGQAQSLEIVGAAHSGAGDQTTARARWTQALALLRELEDPRQTIVEHYLDVLGTVRESGDESQTVPLPVGSPVETRGPCSL